MTIWNALAAGGALWCALMATFGCVTLSRSGHDDDMDTVRFITATALCFGFGLCLFWAIP